MSDEEHERSEKELMEYPLPEKGDRLIHEDGQEDELLLVDPLGHTGHDGKRVSETGRWGLYARGYKHAADLLVKSAPGEFCHDELLYPIIALYRHFVEMRLKGLLVVCSSLGDNPVELASLDKHLIDDLWDRAKVHFKHFSPKLSNEQVQATEKCIRELAQWDRDSQAARYPWNKEGDPSFPDIYSVNIVHLKQVMGKIEHFFDIVDIAVDLIEEWRGEWLSESWAPPDY
jgi:hypothetical protein